jgi:peptide/nickel transport system permease protein
MTIPAGELEGHTAPAIGEAEGADGVGEKVAGRSPTQLAVARFRKDRLSMVSLGICIFYVIAAVAAPILVKLDVLQPLRYHQKLLDVAMGGIPKGSLGGITAGHLLGVEPGTGRDTLSRLMLGMTWSLGIALSGVVITITLGAILGIVSGMSGGVVDGVVGRLIDLTLSFPQTLMLLALSGGMILFITETLNVGNRDLANAIYVVGILGVFASTSTRPACSARPGCACTSRRSCPTCGRRSWSTSRCCCPPTSRQRLPSTSSVSASSRRPRRSATS